MCIWLAFYLYSLILHFVLHESNTSKMGMCSWSKATKRVGGSQPPSCNWVSYHQQTSSLLIWDYLYLAFVSIAFVAANLLLLLYSKNPYPVAINMNLCTSRKPSLPTVACFFMVNGALLEDAIAEQLLVIPKLVYLIVYRPSVTVIPRWMGLHHTDLCWSRLSILNTLTPPA